MIEAVPPELVFVGTGEAFDPDLPNTSLLYRGGRTLLLDCGYGVPHAFWRLSRDPDLLDGVYVTHQHADHAFGLPALLLWMRVGGRTRPLTVIGGRGAASWLDRLLDLAYPGAYEPGKCYPIEVVEASEEQPLSFGPLAIRVARSLHGVRNLAIRIDEGQASMAYSGDGRPSDATRALYRGVSFLVHECYDDEPEVEGHAAASELIPMAASLGIPHLALLHLGVGRRPRIEDRARAASRPDVLLPRPGDRVALG